jgi:acetolactate synthase-1/2/3 large subunit
VRRIGTDAFQEADIRGITMPITKHNYLVTDPADIQRTDREAFHIASTGASGPVLVDISKDALQAIDDVLPGRSSSLPATAVTKPHPSRSARRRLIASRAPVLTWAAGDPARRGRAAGSPS